MKFLTLFRDFPRTFWVVYAMTYILPILGGGYIYLAVSGPVVKHHVFVQALIFVALGVGGFLINRHPRE